MLMLMCISICWIYDPKQKHQALHTSEHTIVPRTVIFSIEKERYLSLTGSYIGDHYMRPNFISMPSRHIQCLALLIPLQGL